MKKFVDLLILVLEISLSVTGCQTSKSDAPPPPAHSITIEEFILPTASFPIYNDGSSGAMTGSSVGDINAAILMIDSAVKYVIVRCADSSCSTVTILSQADIGSVNLGEQHNLSLKWDGTNNRFIFQLDNDTPVSVDPSSFGAPMVQPYPNRFFAGFGVRINGSSGQSGTIKARFDNVVIDDVLYDDFSSNTIDESRWMVYNP